MKPQEYHAFTAQLLERLSAHNGVLGLVALGSMSGEPPGPDAWSDHDFFVVTRTGAQEALRADPAWLKDAGRLVLWQAPWPPAAAEAVRRRLEEAGAA